MNSKKIVKIVVSVVLIGVILSVVDLNQVFQTISQVNPVWYFFGFVMVIIDQSYMGAKWNILLRIVDIKVHFTVPVMGYLKGCAYRYFLPSTLGIDAYKTYYVRKFDSRIANIVSSIIVERFFGILTSLFVVVLMFSFFASYLSLGYETIIAVSCFLGILGFFLLFYMLVRNVDKLSALPVWQWLPKKIKHKIEPALVSLERFQGKSKALYSYIALSIIEKFFYGIILYFCVRSLGIDSVSLLFFVSATPVLSLIDRIPVSFSSIGVREGALVLLLKPFGIPAAEALSIALLMRGIELTQIVIFTLLWQFDHGPKPSVEELNKLNS